MKHFPGIKTEIALETELVQGIFPVMGKTGPDREMLHDYIVKESSEGKSFCKCTVCGKRSASKQNLPCHSCIIHQYSKLGEVPCIITLPTQRAFITTFPLVSH